jgi:hypothetical protein
MIGTCANVRDETARRNASWKAGSIARSVQSPRWESSCSLATRSNVSSTDLMR